MRRTFVFLMGFALAGMAVTHAQTANAGPAVPRLARIQVPRVNIRPVLPGNLIGRSYFYQYPGAGYVATTPHITYRPAPIITARPAPITGQPAEHLNGAVLSPFPAVPANQLNAPARSDLPYTRRQVANVQQGLRRLGFYTGMVDGNLGPETEAAIQSYQVAHGQTVTGLLDRGMLSELGVITRSR